jgi:hypothetical protein
MNAYILDNNIINQEWSVLSIVLDKDLSEYGKNIRCPSNHYQNKTFNPP